MLTVHTMVASPTASSGSSDHLSWDDFKKTNMDGDQNDNDIVKTDDTVGVENFLSPISKGAKFLRQCCWHNSPSSGMRFPIIKQPCHLNPCPCINHQVMNDSESVSAELAKTWFHPAKASPPCLEVTVMCGSPIPLPNPKFYLLPLTVVILSLGCIELLVGICHPISTTHGQQQ